MNKFEYLEKHRETWHWIVEYFKHMPEYEPCCSLTTCTVKVCIPLPEYLSKNCYACHFALSLKDSSCNDCLLNFKYGCFNKQSLYQKLEQSVDINKKIEIAELIRDAPVNPIHFTVQEILELESFPISDLKRLRYE